MISRSLWKTERGLPGTTLSRHKIQELTPTTVNSAHQNPISTRIPTNLSNLLQGMHNKLVRMIPKKETRN